MISKSILCFLVGATCTLVAHAQQDPQRTTPSSSAAVVAATNSMDVLDDFRPLSAGDRVNFRIVEDRDTPPLLLQVSPSGEIEIPMLGRVRASGLTCRKLAYQIKSGLEKNYYRNATVIIGLEAISNEPVGRIYVTGQVMTQGPIELTRDEELTVGKAILRAGGFADFANRRAVKVIRKNPSTGKVERIRVDVKAVIEKGEIEKDVPVLPGDMIVVPERAFNF